MKATSYMTIFAAALAISSCGTSREQCSLQISREQQNVSRLLQHVEANIARGYSIESVPATAPGFRICAGGFGRSSDRVGLGYSTCYGGEQTVRQRVAIDPAAEIRKRDALRARLAALSAPGGARCVSSSDRAL